MERLIITITHWNIILEYNGSHGLGTAHYHHEVFNSQFNAGVRCGGSHTAVSAVLDLLHLDKRKTQGQGNKQWPMPGQELIEAIFFDPQYWTRIDENYSFCAHASIEITPQMTELFPFLQQKVDLFGFGKLHASFTDGAVGYNVRQLFLIFPSAYAQYSDTT